MKFIADLHIHSHFSIATSKLLTPEHLDRWARIKGIRVVGTGDFTHPGWLAELKEKLEPAEEGLFKLKPGLKTKSDWSIPETEENSVRFLLTAEISSIYKKRGKVRKVHNLLFAPDFDAVERIQRRLKSLDFNITSDGRPILGMDSRDLLELALDACPGIFFVPAHIWTPWFSALGEKSGFDRIDECYGDLSGHIHAVETGLSSDPAMNRLCSHLDRYALISNSDAHSPEKLGREANRFDTELSYPAISSALRQKDAGGFLGTLEFFPQEGKYHHDGHRKCGISWAPEETLLHNEVCPVCGGRVTVGVLHRVHQLADRRTFGDEMQDQRPFRSMIPLIEILSEIRNSGTASKSVVRDYAALVQKLGPEIQILLELPIEEVQKAGGELAAEAVRRMRSGEVFIEAGYDGEYGKIKVFGPEDGKSIAQSRLFGEAPAGPKKSSGIRFRSAGADQDEGTASAIGKFPKRMPVGNAREIRLVAEKPQEYAERDEKTNEEEKPHAPGSTNAASRESGSWSALNPEQRAAAEHGEGPAMVLAGPGTGKTAVLTWRVALLVRRGVTPDVILVITFTNKAADEIRDRLSAILGDPLLDMRTSLTVNTFHAFGHSVLKEHASLFGRTEGFTIFDEDEKAEILKSVVPDHVKVRTAADWIRRAKQNPSAGESPSNPEFASLLERYEIFLQRENGFDFDDLIAKPVRLFRDRPEIRRLYRQRFRHILVDEYQDTDAAQVEWVRMLTGEASDKSDRPAALWVVGDPDQSIYGFRGASPAFIHRFGEDYPGAVVYSLIESYRCSDIVLSAAGQVIRGSEFVHRASGFGHRDSGIGNRNSDIGYRDLDIERPTLHGLEAGVKIRIVQHSSDASEAEFVARTIESMAGGLRFFSMDSGVASGYDDSGYALSDFAVLCRVGRQMEAFEKAFQDHGIPVQKSDTEPFYRREPARSVVAILKSAVRKSGSEFRVSSFELKKTKSNSILINPDHLSEMVGKETIRGLIERIIKTVPEAADPKHRLEMEQLLDLAEPFGRDVGGFVKALSLGSGLDLFRPDIQSVALMTLHAAKGLEFSCVFIPGCEDGLLPYRLSGREEGDPEEDRRLLYVGMTRAKRHLFLTHAGRRTLFGRALSLPRSPFLDAIEEELVERGESKFRKRKSGGDPQMDLF